MRRSDLTSTTPRATRRDPRPEARRLAWEHAAEIVRQKHEDGWSIADAEGVDPDSAEGRRLERAMDEVRAVLHSRSVGTRRRSAGGPRRPE